MSKAQRATEEQIEKLVEARYALRVEMLEKINDALVEDNNRLGAEVERLRLALGVESVDHD